MASFAYKGLNRAGKAVNGKISANTEGEARARLKQMGTRVRSIKSGDNKGDVKGWRPIRVENGQVFLELTPPTVKIGEIVVFTKQLSTMIDAGVGLVQGLDMLAAQQHNHKFKSVIINVRVQIENGSELAEAMQRHSDVFDNLFCSLVHAGSAAGQLDVMLRRLSVYLEKSNKLKKQLMSALTYPAIVVLLAVGLTCAMLFFVVPMFAKNFADSGKQLPWLTLQVMAAADYLKRYFVLIFAGAFAAHMGLQKWRKTPSGRAIFDTIILKAPVFGNLITKIALARFSGTMATLIASGIPIIEALEICSKAAGNAVIENEIIKIKDDVAKGRGLGVPMSESKLIPLMVSGMVSIGEASGNLDAMLSKISEFYEEDVDAAIAGALKLVEPIMFVVIGAIVGVILIAMYLPVFDMAGNQG